MQYGIDNTGIKFCMIKKRILVVDDEPDITMVISIMLESRGFEVDSFNDPVLALSNFQPGHYDLVLLDIIMPEMNGFELYNQIKKVDSHVMACFLTASNRIYYNSLRPQIDKGTRVQGEAPRDYELSTNMVLRKPVSIEDLVREINKRIKQRFMWNIIAN